MNKKLNDIARPNTFMKSARAKINGRPCGLGECGINEAIAPSSDPADQSLDLMGEFVGKALAEAPGGGLSVEQLAVNVARAMQTDKSKDLDVKGIALAASMMQNIYLPKLMRSGYVEKEGDEYALTDGGLSHYTEVVRSRVALEERIEDMLRQEI